MLTSTVFQPIFAYGETELAWLKRKDYALAAAIDRIGPIARAVMPDLFAALVHAIVGQQISTKAANTVWIRLQERCGSVTPAAIQALGAEEIQPCGLSMRKTMYIKHAAASVLCGELDIAALPSLPDAEICARLSSLNGIGRWTAEMLLIFSLQRPDVLSRDDLAIQRGLRMLYRHRAITPALFNKYKRRYSPYASVASLYLWAVAGGA